MIHNYVQIGCGFAAAQGWLNFDASPTLRVERLPLVGSAIGRLAGNASAFPVDVRYGDIVKGLPLAPDSVDAIYASHVLEHLSLADMRTALARCFEYLRPGGVFRLIVPDLEARARLYVESLNRGDEAASLRFMRSCFLGAETRPKGFLGVVRAVIGNSGHLWMWDEASMRHELANIGFEKTRRATFGDSDDAMFARVENPHRFVDDGIVEVALETRKPEQSASGGQAPRLLHS